MLHANLYRHVASARSGRHYVDYGMQISDALGSHFRVWRHRSS